MVGDKTGPSVQTGGGPHSRTPQRAVFPRNTAKWSREMDRMGRAQAYGVA